MTDNPEGDDRPRGPIFLRVTKQEGGRPSIDIAASDDDRREALDDLTRSLGVLEGDAASLLLSHLTQLIDLESRSAEGTVNGILGLLRSIEPQNALEAMLVVQMIAVHMAVLEQAKFARLSGTTAGNELHVKLMAKLAKAFALQIDALTGYRSKRRSTIVVEHVQVERTRPPAPGRVGKQQRGRSRNEGQPHERVRVSKRPPMLS